MESISFRMSGHRVRKRTPWGHDQPLLLASWRYLVQSSDILLRQLAHSSKRAVEVRRDTGGGDRLGENNDVLRDYSSASAIWTVFRHELLTQVAKKNVRARKTVLLCDLGDDLVGEQGRVR